MVLPTIKCSSCGDPIPLAAMGDHICRPPSRSAKSPRSKQRHYDHYDEPLPSPSYSQSRSGPSSSRQRHDRSDRDRDRDRDRAPVRPAFGGPSPMSPPGGLQIPPSSSASSSSRLSPHSASSNSRSPSPHTPSPTNPFFPAQAAEQPDPGLSVFGFQFQNQGIRPEGPFPNDRPLPTGVSDLLSLTGDDKPGGGSGVGGMAGVGRRAFQAAAWGVTAGVAMASRSKTSTPQPSSAPMSSQPRSAGAEPTSGAPWQHPSADIQPPPRSGSSQQRHRGGTDPKPADFYPVHNDIPPRSASALDKRHHKPAVPPSPPRSTSIQQSRSADHNHGYHRPPPRHQANGSLSSATSIGSPDPGISGMLRSRANERTPKSSAKSGGGFFDRYKQMQASSSANDSRRLLSVGKGSRDDHGHRQRALVDSPEQSVYDLADAYEDMDGDSALPWATPQLEDSPEIKQSDKLPRIRTNPSKLHHQRHRAGDSEASSNSSGSRRYDLTSGPESEEVVTPSTSFEGLSERMQNGRKPSKDRYGYDIPQDRRPPVAPVRKGTDPSRDRDRERVPKSSSNSTITLKERSRTLPDPSPSVSSSRSRSTPKTCAKCGDTVGGSRKFVERDGVVLCEADWKKMYLPSCRKCHQLIETKMVSADDGQLKGKWHASCFTCSRCDKPFEGKDFYVHAGRPWCQYHYAKET